MSETIHVVLCRNRHESSQQQKLIGQFTDALPGHESIALWVTPHLYDLTPDGTVMEQLRTIEGDLIVGSWLHPRAAFWVLDANGIGGRMGQSDLIDSNQTGESVTGSGRHERTIWCFDLRQFDDAAPLLAEIERIRNERVGPGPSAEAVAGQKPVELEEPTRRRWYPVVDRSRCANCLDCLNFCLFGVFGIDRQEQLLVEAPDACKDGCPACSRVCSAGAIMFPDHQDPVIAGDASGNGGQVNLDLVQLFDATSSLDLTAAEREQIRSKLPPTAASCDCPTCSHDDLDDLVDGLDEEAF